MYSNEEKAIILAKQAQNLGIAAIITQLILLLPVSMICCIDGYCKAKKAKTLAPENSIVKSGYRIANISRWGLIVIFAILVIVGAILSFYSS